MGGAAITISLQQLKGFLGIKDFTKKTDIISVMRSVFSSVNHGVRSLSSQSHISVIFVHFILLYSFSFKKSTTLRLSKQKQLQAKLLKLILQHLAVELADYTDWSDLFMFSSIC